jgi:hypothetical protein
LAITKSDVVTSNMMTRHPVVNGEHIEYDDVRHHARGDGMADDEWGARVKGILKAELKRRNMGYRELAERLGALGVHETERNIANKISRGGFSAVFFVQCLVAIGCPTIRLDLMA